MIFSLGSILSVFLPFTYEAVGWFLNVTQLKHFFMSCNETDCNHCVKSVQMWTRKTPYLDPFHAVNDTKWEYWDEVGSTCFIWTVLVKYSFYWTILAKYKKRFYIASMQFLNLEICKVSGKLIDKNVVFFRYNIAYMLNLLVRYIWQ